MGTQPDDYDTEIPKEVFSRFVVGPKLAERPSCFVFRGIDRELGDRAVALKFFVDKPLGREDWIKGFEREISVLRAASHPALVPIISGGFDRGWFFIAMELIEGMTLRDHLKAQKGPFAFETAVEIASQIAGGLKEIHEKNGYHGHLDSRAILFKGDDPRLAGYYPHVMSDIQKSVTGTGRLIVDPAYVSPDQITGGGAVDGRSDIYALSVLLYEMLTGQKPYVADNPVQLAMMRLTKDPDPPRKLNPGISPLLDAAVMRGLARDRNQRFATVMEFVDALTGGKKPLKNPLLAAVGAEGGERLTGTETIPVSMSTDAIKHILQAHEAKAASKPAPAEDVAGTQTGRKAVMDSNEQLSGAATMIGMKVDDSLKGSFMIVNGDLRGKKMMLERPQVMIGSDPGCDICLSGKGLPPRYAIVVQRNGDYFVGALSGTPVVMNGKTSEGSEERKLTRGDVLLAGPHQLRFIAPGEVFTLREDVADRVVDRPPNKLPKLIATAAVVAILVCGGLFYLYKQNLDANARKQRIAAEATKKKKAELIDTLRREGDEFFRTGALLEPVDANARKRFEQILEIDPEDSYSKRRLAEIEEQVRALAEQEGRRKQFADRIAKLMADGERFFNSGNYISPPGSNAREMYQEVLRLDSRNEAAQKQLLEINRILGDMIGQVNTLLTKARTHMEAKQYVSPPGENAKDLVDQVLRVDPNNADAKNLLIEMAARSLMDGEAARASLDPDAMRTAFLTAKAIGVDGAYIDKKLQGIETMKRSKGGIVIIDTSKQTEPPKGDGRSLDMDEIEKRINLLQLQGYGQDGNASKKFYEINRGKIQ